MICSLLVSDTLFIGIFLLDETVNSTNFGQIMNHNSLVCFNALKFKLSGFKKSFSRGIPATKLVTSTTSIYRPNCSDSRTVGLASGRILSSTVASRNFLGSQSRIRRITSFPLVNLALDSCLGSQGNDAVPAKTFY